MRFLSSKIAVFGSTSRTRLFLLVSAVVALYYITAHGIDYVSWPRLNQLGQVINYSGKGFESARKGRGPASFHGKPLSKTSAIRNQSISEASSYRRESVQGIGQPLPGGSKVTPAMQQEQFKRAPDADASKKRVD